MCYNEYINNRTITYGDMLSVNFVYLNVSECSWKYIFKEILNLDIETFTSISDCIAFHII